MGKLSWPQEITLTNNFCVRGQCLSSQCDRLLSQSFYDSGALMCRMTEHSAQQCVQFLHLAGDRAEQRLPVKSAIPSTQSWRPEQRKFKGSLSKLVWPFAKTGSKA